jgi:CRP/FNR family transcriptional regulator, dissimilatory nitrate respiration regulator
MNATTAPDIAGVAPLQRSIAAGSFLFQRTDPTIGIFVLGSGRLLLQRVTPDGNTVTLHTPRAGELFAEASLFSENYHCDALAVTRCEVWLYPKELLVRLLRDDPRALWEFAATLARSLQSLRLRYELKQIRSAPQRVLQLLHLRCDANGIYRSEGTLKDTAAELGLTHEALYRALAVLERDGIIARGSAGIEILHFVD